MKDKKYKKIYSYQSRDILGYLSITGYAWIHRAFGISGAV